MGASSLPGGSETDDLQAIIRAVLALPGELTPAELDRILRLHPKQGRGFYPKREILRAFREDAARWSVGEEDFARRLRTCPTRSISGVTPVTVLTRPFPCPGRCVFCPSDVRMPKSYLRDEPGCQRAEANRFDPYLQTWNRLAAYHDMGHPTSKVELIVLGGTWSYYPAPYQRWFLLRCLDALNDFGSRVDGRALAEASAGSAYLAPEGSPADARGRYNVSIAPALAAAAAGATPESASFEELARAQDRNASAGARQVGLSLETRPDRIDAAEVRRLRRLGATKIQLGIQSLDDDVLRRNQRGHDAAASRRAMTRLRAAGFKLQVHWMVNLLGATPASDRRDFARLFDDRSLRPDELKLYPCSLVETAELVDHHRRGDWLPYPRDVLVELLADLLERVPRWCRVTRVIRDIPSPDILCGSRETNLREPVEARVHARGGAIREIRSREVRGRAVEVASLVLAEEGYEAGAGRELFLGAEDPEGRLAGFLRLALPAPGVRAGGPDSAEPDGHEASPGLGELRGAAIVRELHVYGAALEVGAAPGAGPAQHGGLGRRLLARAAQRAREAGHRRLAVISAAGTRAYYRGLGFEDGELYQHRDLG
jgi:elongator complex protein 3